MADATVYVDGTRTVTLYCTNTWTTAPTIGDIIVGSSSGATLKVTSTGGIGENWVTGHAIGNFDDTTPENITSTGTMAPDPNGLMPFGAGSSGDADGTSWSKALCGERGLQEALDNVVDGNDTDVFVRNTFTLSATIDIDTSGGSRQNNKFLNIVGCDAAGDELANGSYNIWDGQEGGIDIVEIAGVDNVGFRHIHFKDGGTGGDYRGILFSLTDADYNFIFDHCKVSGCRYGLQDNTGYVYGLLIYGGDIYGERRAILSRAHGGLFLGAYLSNNYAGMETVRIYNQAMIQQCVVKNSGNYWCIWLDAQSEVVIANNVIYGYDGITMRQPTTTLIAYNNMYFLSHDTCIQCESEGGSILYNDYEATNLASGGWSVEPANLVRTANDVDTIWVDAPNGDFRLVSASPLLNTGRPTFGGNQDGSLDGYSSIGCWGRQQNIGCQLVRS